MEASIQDFIDRIAQDKGIEILYAAESGSRAWGFPSPDSDYDVRFIYRQSIDWYLSIRKQKDTVEVMEDHLLDGMGWDLRKTLSLAASSNVSPFMWLQSPIVYRNEDNFRERLWDAILPYFSPRAAVHHYLGIAEGIYRREFLADKVKIKHYFYVLRPVLAARYIWEQQSPPPMLFHDLLPLLKEQSDSLMESIENLLRRKEVAVESQLIEHLPELDKFLQSQLEEGRLRAGKLKRGAADSAPLDAFFREVVMKRDE